LSVKEELYLQEGTGLVLYTPLKLGLPGV